MYEVFAKYSIDKKNYFSYIAIRKARKAHSPVAQSAEQVAVNHWVPGSSPGGGASEAVVKRQSPFLLSGTVTIHNIRPPPGLETKEPPSEGEEKGPGMAPAGSGDGLEGIPGMGLTGRRERAGEQTRRLSNDNRLFYCPEQ